MPTRLCACVPAIAFALMIGCGRNTNNGAPTSSGRPRQLTTTSSTGASDPRRLRDADLSILFVGNSHTSLQDLPELVCRMIQFRRPDWTVYGHAVLVAHLDDIAGHPTGMAEIDSRRWDCVVLQAQNISSSGRYFYSTDVGIELARKARARGARVLYYSEWGLRGRAGHGRHHEMIYRAMASAASADVITVGRAWDLVMAERPHLPLYESDDNHQSELGAFLTACVIYSGLTGESAAPLAAFPYPAADEATRAYLAEAAARSQGSGGPGGRHGPGSLPGNGVD